MRIPIHFVYRVFVHTLQSGAEVYIHLLTFRIEYFTCFIVLFVNYKLL